MKEMIEEFVNYDIYSNGKMTKLSQHQVHQGRSACGPSVPSQADSKRLVNLLHMSEMTQPEVDLIFKETNCLLC